MATDLFTRAKAYRKKHPSTAWTDCVKAVAAADRKKPAAKKKAAAKKKPAVKHKRAAPKKHVRAVGSAKRKKAAPATKRAATPKVSATRKIKVRIKKTGAGNPVISIGKKPAAANTKLIKQMAKDYGLTMPHGYEAKTRVRGISGISMDKINQELQHQHSLGVQIKKHQEMLKEKGLKPAEKARIRREIAHYKNAVTSSKKHVTALKRSI